MFSLYVIPVVLQLVVPLLLLAGVAFGRPRSRAAWLLQLLLTATWLVAIRLDGLWLLMPPWVSMCLFVLLAGAIVWGRHLLVGLPSLPRTRAGWGEVVAATSMLAVGVWLATVGVTGRQPPAAQTIDLTFPLRNGTYYVAGGGSSVLLNPHLQTLAGARFAAYRGQSYGTDIVELNDAGARASGIAPSDPRRYAIFGDPVYAPCAGRVLVERDGAPDMHPPQTDRVNMAGNYVLLDCGAAYVLLGHLQQGSVEALTGDWVTTKDRIGRVGNSGNASEPHLHIHAQRPVADLAVFMSGEPLVATFDGRYLSRNDVVRPVPPVSPPQGWTMTEHEMLYGQLGSSIVALLMLGASLWWPALGRALFVILFAWASQTNLRTAILHPEAYLDYASLAVLDTYRQFIGGFFAAHVTAIVSVIAAAQGAIALLLIVPGWPRRAALAGAMVFLIAIVPLGVGSGFPATVVMAMGAWALLRAPAPVARRVRATRAEHARSLPGDDLLPVPLASETHAITISRPPGDVWPWLVQMGAGRAGWYSYDLLDNGRHPSATEIVPQLQQITVGQLFPALPRATDGFVVQAFEPTRFLTLEAPSATGDPKATWTFVLDPMPPDATRLIVRARIAYRPLDLPMWLSGPLLHLVHDIMERKQLLGIAARAEHVYG